ncbi:MAG: hypothetical protein R2693_01120 [Nocardioidaceae bacterium]
MAVVSDKRWYLAVAAGYVLAFWCLTLGLAQGLAIGAAYGIWAASGVALTATRQDPLNCFPDPDDGVGHQCNQRSRACSS